VGSGYLKEESTCNKLIMIQAITSQVEHRRPRNLVV